MKISKEIKIGLTVVASIGFFIWGFNFLKGKDVFSKERKYYAIYNTVNGLVKSNPVFVNGYRVGLVKEIHFHKDGSNRLVVCIAVTNSLPIPSNTVAKIYSSDLMGSKAIDLVMGNSSKMAKSGDTLTSGMQASFQEEVNRQVLPLKAKAESLMLSIDSAMTVIRYVFNEKTRENLEKSFASIQQTIANLESTSYNIDTLISTQRGRMGSIISNIESISSNIKNNNQKISNIISHFSELSDTIARLKVSETINKLNSTLGKTADIMGKIDKGQGSLGLLINSDSLHRELTASSNELKLLLEDMRLNPHRYLNFSVFGPSTKKNANKTTKGK